MLKPSLPNGDLGRGGLCVLPIERPIDCAAGQAGKVVAVIAAQLYTVREFTKTPGDIAKTLHKVKAVGYDAVQLSALGPVDPRELREHADAAQLEICATHVPFDRLRTELDEVVEEHRIWGCDYIALGAAPKEYRDADGYRRLAPVLSAIGGELADAGITFAYHNHSFELARYDGTTGLEILLGETDPDAVAVEIDTYWIQHGGGDPAAWISWLAGRIPLVHLKDMVVDDGTPTFAEVGQGNLNWPSILEACRAAGVRWHIVEQDRCAGDPFESLRISRENLRSVWR